MIGRLPFYLCLVTIVVSSACLTMVSVHVTDRNVVATLATSEAILLAVRADVRASACYKALERCDSTIDAFARTAEDICGGRGL